MLKDVEPDPEYVNFTYIQRNVLGSLSIVKFEMRNNI